MVDSMIIRDIQQAKEGNELAREKIISSHRPYIVNVVSHICKRFVSWSDEEASIGLLAFNRAIDTYDPEKGRKFLSFAYFLIQRDLINYFHSSEKRNRHIVLNLTEDENALVTEAEIEKAIQYYREKVTSNDLVEEILELDKALRDYGIGFEELENSSPRHEDTRVMLCKIALDFVEDKELVEDLIKKKRFPAAAFVKKTGYSLKTVERHRKYLITLVVINLHPEWTHLTSRIKICEEGGDGFGTKGRYYR